MSVHKDNKSGKWYVKYKNKTIRGFDKKWEAERCEAKQKLGTENEEAEIVAPSVVVSEKEPVLFHDVALDFVRYKELDVEYGSYKKIESAVKNVIIPNTKNKEMSKIVESDCRKFKEYLHTLDYVSKYKNNFLNIYIAIFKHSKVYFSNQNDPTYVLEKFKRTYDETLRKREKESNIWGLEEFDSFIECVDKDMFKELFVVLYYTGLRLGEALALTWDDFENGKLDVKKSLTRKTKNRGFEIKQPKNVSSIRVVSIGRNLTEYLTEFKQREMRLYGFRNGWYMFGRTKPLPQTSIDRVKHKAVSLSGVTNIRIHDLRHSHASYLIGSGINIVAVSKRLGHSDVNTTMKTYVHLVQKAEEELVDFVEKSSQNLLRIFSA